LIGEVPGLASHWNFVPSDPGAWFSARRAVRRWIRRRRAPARTVLKPVPPHPEWLVYFVFAPVGELSAAHRFSLERLRDMACRVLVVCAAREPGSVPKELFGLADALYWKALSGYDFSAYEVALSALCERSPHCAVCVVNDSVYGPFADLRPFLRGAAWELSGFTASSLFQNHLQSYAFVIRDLAPARLARLRSVLPRGYAYNAALDVIYCQELLLAGAAAEAMSVGAWWYSRHEEVADATLVKPLELLRAGFPFMKKSVLGKHARFQAQSQDALRAHLAGAGHPNV
jgi:lipopolysaccharide biosynthesis protein